MIRHGLGCTALALVTVGWTATAVMAQAQSKSSSSTVIGKGSSPRNDESSRAGEPRTMIENSVGMKLVLIPAGEFEMGSDEEPADEKPRHRVKISKPFRLSSTEVTQGQYRDVLGESPSDFKGADTRPVERVSWFDAVKFCNALSASEKRSAYYEIKGDDVHVVGEPGAGYRLPTEAEWEYACRAGSSEKYSFGDDANKLGEYGWFIRNSRGKRSPETHNVGMKAANAFGLFDMHGNVWEWCEDRYAPDYYQKSAAVDPHGATAGTLRVARGGGWNYDAQYCRSASRDKVSPKSRRSRLGFRVAL
jgi:formylglycine-generating enzyme required for sulfatase activity